MSDTTRAESIAFSDDRRRSAACGFLTALVFVVAVVVARRLSGDAQPLPEWGAALIGVLAIGVTTFCTLVPGVMRNALDRPARLMATGLSTTPGLLLGLALLPAGSVGGVASLLCIFFGAMVAGTLAEEWSPWSEGRLHLQLVEARRALAARPRHMTPEPRNSQDNFEFAGELREESASPLSTHPSPAAVSEAGLPVDETAAVPFGESVPHPSENLETTQWMSRSLNETGDCAEGGCQAVFEAGQKLALIHIPFAPAFAVAPEFECEPLDESDVQIKTAARRSYGVRIEVTRKVDLDSEQTIPLGWFAFGETVEQPAAAA